MKRSLCAALLLSLGLFACAADPAPGSEADETMEVQIAEEAETESLPSAKRTPFCLPGEKVSCTLGPPPVCRCVPTTPPVLAP